MDYFSIVYNYLHRPIHCSDHDGIHADNSNENSGS
jgi:hypothetical protein